MTVSTETPDCGPGAPNGQYDVQHYDISAIYGQVTCMSVCVLLVYMCVGYLSRLSSFALFQKHLALHLQVYLPL